MKAEGLDGTRPRQQRLALGDLEYHLSGGKGAGACEGGGAFTD